MNPDIRLLRMMVKESFIDLFWEDLIAARKIDPTITREKVFNEMNNYFFNATGSYRYIDYDCFRRGLRSQK